jgi:hypothetical protein
MPVYIPGLNQQTAATLQIIRQGMGVRSTTKRRTKRRTKSRAKPAKRRKTRTRSKKPARLVKGSAAAKRYMAKIRRKRK